MEKSCHKNQKENKRESKKEKQKEKHLHDNVTIYVKYMYLLRLSVPRQMSRSSKTFGNLVHTKKLRNLQKYIIYVDFHGLPSAQLTIGLSQNGKPCIDRNALVADGISLKTMKA